MLQDKLDRMQPLKFRITSWTKAIPIGILLLCLGLLAYKVYLDWETLLAFDWEIQYIWLIPSVLLFLAQTVITVGGWRSILNRLAPPIPFWRHVKIYCYTTLARRIPAGLILQVTGRMYWYRQLNISAYTAAIASFLELWLVILTGLPIGALHIGTITSLETQYILLIYGLTVVIIAILIQSPILGWVFSMFKREKLEINLSARESLRWMGIYTAVWLLSGTSLFVTTNLFYDLSLRVLPEIIGVWTLASLTSYLTLLTPGGFGIKELSLTFLLGFYLPEPLPLIIALVVRILGTVYEIFAGLASMAM
jgi:glycosyltransferase 2 family protein